MLKTCTTDAVTNIGGGCYYHFKLANGSYSIVGPVSVLMILINTGGVPVYKSTNAQFWPLLGLVANCVHREPFIIGLYYGNSKPHDVNKYLDHWKATECSGGLHCSADMVRVAPGFHECLGCDPGC